MTDQDRAVVISDGARMVVVSPEDREAFVAAIGTGEMSVRAEEAGGGSGGLDQPGGWASLAWALRRRRCCMRPGVVLTGDGLEIQSRFYGMTVGRGEVDVAGVRVVDLAAEPGWKPVLRTNGFGNPNYRAGDFQTADGRKVRLYTTGAGRLVLLPRVGGEAPVLLEAEDPEGLAGRVGAVWGR